MEKESINEERNDEVEKNQLKIIHLLQLNKSFFITNISKRYEAS